MTWRLRFACYADKKIGETIHPPPAAKSDERYIVTDGVDYYFTMSVKGHGLVTAKAEPAEERTFVWRMSEFVETLSEYAKGKVSVQALKKALAHVEPNRPNQALQPTADRGE
jgi:hypothetical protein